MTNRSVKRILIINVNWLGDVIFSTPFIRAVRLAYPDAHISCLLHPRCREVLESNKRIDEIIIYDEDRLHSGMIGKLKLIVRLRRLKFDMAFILHRSFTKALITYLAGISQRAGYATKGRSFLLTNAVVVPKPPIHKVEYFLKMADSCGIAAKDASYEFFVEDKARKEIREILKSGGIVDADRVVVLCPGGNWDPKRWPKENFAKLGDMLCKDINFKIVISGSPKDVPLANETARMMRSPSFITCGRTNIKQLAALLERADLVVANDSGPMHLAVAVGARVIALFGPTSPALTGPYGKGRYKVITSPVSCDLPCYDPSCRDYKCMAAIKVDDVFGEARKMVAE